jgi:hypothetical protein
LVSLDLALIEYEDDAMHALGPVEDHSNSLGPGGGGSPAVSGSGQERSLDRVPVVLRGDFDASVAVEVEPAIGCVSGRWRLSQSYQLLSHCGFLSAGG